MQTVVQPLNFEIWEISQLHFNRPFEPVNFLKIYEHTQFNKIIHHYKSGHQSKKASNA